MDLSRTPSFCLRCHRCLINPTTSIRPLSPLLNTTNLLPTESSVKCLVNVEEPPPAGLLCPPQSPQLLPQRALHPLLPRLPSKHHQCSSKLRPLLPRVPVFSDRWHPPLRKSTSPIYDACQRHLVRDARPPAFRLLNLGWQKRPDHRQRLSGTSASILA